MNQHRVPVIVGIGELVDKSSDPALEPVEMLRRCALAAGQEAGGDILRRVDSIRVVSSMSWPYRDLAGLLARKLRLRAVEGVHGPVGGESPVRLLVDAASDIAQGYSEAAIVCGAEATKTLMLALKRGQSPNWEDKDPLAPRISPDDFVTPMCSRYGLALPTDVYPLFENAARAAWGLTFEESQAESGTIWSGMSRVAASNPYAWSGNAMAAADIVNPSAANRMIAFPYTKFQVAQIGVNQASAVLLTHRDSALAAGIAEDKLVYVWAGAGAHDPHDVLARDRYDHSPALVHSITRTLAINGLSAADLDFVELYSCFPIVPKLARRALGLPADAALSVSGGLTFFGGPTNNFMGHAITAMVRALRGGVGRTGLLHGNGEFVTKHHCAVLASTPPPAAVAVRNHDLQEECDSAYGPVPPLLENYEGPVVIETFTVTYTANGKADRGTVIARTPQGERVLARVTENAPEALAMLLATDRSPVGASGHVYDGGDGLNHFALEAPSVLPVQQVLFEKISPHVALVTLNRPEKRNTVNGAVARLLARYVKQVDEDPELRVAILAANGDKAFCAGADLAEAAAGRGAELSVGANGFAGFVNAKRRKPWIAAVRGFAMGGGTELTLACDLAVAGHSAVFGLPEVKRGLVAAAGGAYRLPRALAPRVAMEMILTGGTVSAARALELHLVNRLTADETLLEEAANLAESIAQNAPLAVIQSRDIVHSAFNHSDQRLAEMSIDAIMGLTATEDFQEGQRAFLEKRSPEWKSR